MNGTTTPPPLFNRPKQFRLGNRTFTYNDSTGQYEVTQDDSGSSGDEEIGIIGKIYRIENMVYRTERSLRAIAALSIVNCIFIILLIVTLLYISKNCSLQPFKTNLSQQNIQGGRR